MAITNFPATEFVPQRLTKEEIDNPCIVIISLFDYAHLPQIREMLWDLLKIAISGTWNSLSSTDRADVLDFFEKLKKVIEAIHLIYKQSSLFNCKTSNEAQIP